MAHTAKEQQVTAQCRVCWSILTNGINTNWPNIFTGANFRVLPFIIKEVTGQEIKQHENVPECICPSCLEAANTAFNFKRRFEHSFQLLTHNKELINPVWVQQQFEREKTEKNCTQKIKIENTSGSESEDDDSEDSSQSNSIDNQPVDCPQCSKPFRDKNCLRRHLRIHAVERPFKCDHCIKAFTQNDHLEKHLRTHEKERRFVCPQCFKAFIKKDNLMYHIRTHTGERPYKCDHCTKDFRQKSHMVRHIRTHTGERPYECTRCSKAFGVLSSLKRHLSLHTDETLPRESGATESIDDREEKFVPTTGMAD